MMRAVALVSSSLLVAGAACAPPPARCPEVTPTATATATAAVPPPAKGGPRVALRIHPHPGAAVDVTVRVTADASALGTFSIAPDGALASFHLGAVEDDEGPLAAAPVALPDGRVQVRLPRAVRGELRLSYSVDPRARPGGALPGVDPDPGRLLASGEPLLLLPDALDDRPVRATIEIEPEGYVINDGHRASVDAASSFGVGRVREVEARGRELRGGFYVAGALGRAVFEAVEGHDEAAWLGYTSFDPRPIAADVAAFRTAVRELFRFGEETPLTLLILSDGRAPGAFSVARRARSVVARVGAGEAWTGPVRIAVATEVLHAWIGGRLWIGPDDPAREAEGYWFSEGVARHLARDLLFRYGLITSREVLDEVHGLFAAGLTSPWARLPTAEVAAHVKEPQALSTLVARGALYATGLSARLQQKSGGKRALVDVLRPLFAKARERGGPLSREDWVAAVGAELGADEREPWGRSVWEGVVDNLPDGALGPCFRAAPREYVGFDLGFDEEATRAAADRRIVGLRVGGPAEKAGIRAGDELVEAVVGRGRGDVPVTITVKRGDETKVVKYLPAGLRTKGARGFVRKADVAEEACAR